ncbi:MAG: GntR family transcriptional regulator [Candidatus Pacebacteria bacterium]|nr:GntR family transcriptional regulator [Candidatus Paceibacterota bacterium]
MVHPTKQMESGSQELNAYRMLVREIYRRGLTCGAKLPPQEDLRQEIGFSHATLSRAMERLVADGVIQRKQRIGTVIRDPDAVDLSVWTVALLLNWDLGNVPSPFFSRLTCLLQQKLVAAGCQCRVYPHVNVTMEEPHRIADYVNLENDVEAGTVDAVLTPGSLADQDRMRLTERTIPVCFSTGWQLAACGCVIDAVAFARAAVESLEKQGAMRLGVVAAGYSRGYNSLYDESRLAVRNVPGGCVEFIEAGCIGIAGGRRAAEIVLDRPRAERPDALIVDDDHIALGLSQFFKLESDYAPPMAVLTHQAAPLTFALPVLHFELDDEELADRAVRLIIERLRHPELPDRVEWLAPRFAGSDADYSAAGTMDELEALSGTLV